MSQKEKESHLWKRKPTGLHSLPTPHHFLSTILKMWSNLEQRSPSFLFPNLIPLLAERNKKEDAEEKLKKEGKKEEKIVEKIRTELAFLRGVIREAKCAASLLFFFFFPFFSPSQILLFGDKWVRRKGIINSDFTVAVAMGERSKKGGFKEMLAASQQEAPSWAAGCCAQLLPQDFGLCQPGGSWIKVEIEQMVKCSTSRLTEFSMGQYVFVGAAGGRMDQPIEQHHRETTSKVPWPGTLENETYFFYVKASEFISKEYFFWPTRASSFYYPAVLCFLWLVIT